MLGRFFDPSLPLVATSSFDAGEAKIAAGDVFDWRAHGVVEHEALAMFSAGLLMTAPDAAVDESKSSSTTKPKRK